MLEIKMKKRRNKNIAKTNSEYFAARVLPQPRMFPRTANKLASETANSITFVTFTKRKHYERAPLERLMLRVGIAFSISRGRWGTRIGIRLHGVTSLWKRAHSV